MFEDRQLPPDGKPLQLGAPGRYRRTGADSSRLNHPHTLPALQEVMRRPWNAFLCLRTCGGSYTLNLLAYLQNAGSSWALGGTPPVGVSVMRYIRCTDIAGTPMQAARCPAPPGMSSAFVRRNARCINAHLCGDTTINPRMTALGGSYHAMSTL